MGKYQGQLLQGVPLKGTMGFYNRVAFKCLGFEASFTDSFQGFKGYAVLGFRIQG